MHGDIPAPQTPADSNDSASMIIFPQPDGLQIRLDANSVLGRAFSAVALELFKAQSANPPMHSLHEALGVIREEYVEFELEVFKNPRKHPGRLALAKAEAKQLAAMAIRCMVDVR